MREVVDPGQRWAYVVRYYEAGEGGYADSGGRCGRDLDTAGVFSGGAGGEQSSIYFAVIDQNEHIYDMISLCSVSADCQFENIEYGFLRKDLSCEIYGVNAIGDCLNKQVKISKTYSHKKLHFDFHSLKFTQE